MAALHAQFGHTKVGLMALQEAIRLAQESNDHICLQHALTWLYTLSPTHKAQLIKRSLIKSDHLNLNYLNWLGLLNHTTLMAKTTIAPSKLIQSVSTAGSVGGKSRAWGQMGLWSVLAGIWTGWGSVSMTVLCSQLLLHISPLLANAPEVSYASSPSCTALCNIAMALANMGDYQLSAEVIQHAKEQFPQSNIYSHFWSFSEAHIRLTELLHQGMWTQAETVISSIATTHQLQARHRNCVLLVSKGETTKALKAVEELLSDSQIPEEPELHAQCLLVKAEALVSGGNFGAALPILVSAHNIAYMYHLAYMAALIKLHLSAVQVINNIIHNITMFIFILLEL